MRTINYAGYRMVRGFRSIIYKSNGEIHYISGTDVLPVPLEGEEEKSHCYVGNGGRKRART